MKVPPLALIGIGANLSWYAVAVAGGVFIARHPPVHQDWWLIPYAWGAFLGWLPSTVIGLVAGWWGLRQGNDATALRRLWWGCIALAIGSPVVGIVSFIAANSIRRL